jgi:uncharacterized coiled-coil protein SlyX
MTAESETAKLARTNPTAQAVMPIARAIDRLERGLERIAELEATISTQADAVEELADALGAIRDSLSRGPDGIVCTMTAEEFDQWAESVDELFAESESEDEEE